MALPPEFHIRKYTSTDREAVRRLCCDTGFLGKPIDPVFEDRELFADYLTAYYTDIEPEAAFVLEHHGNIKGYLLGCRHPGRQKIFDFFQNSRLFVTGILRYKRYNSATRAYIRWILRDSWKEVPPAPRGTAHFHFNVLPEARNLASTQTMVNLFIDYLRANGEKEVFGQLVTFESRRGTKVLERFGFRVVEKKAITKYRDLYHEPVYLTTVIKKIS